LTQKHEKEKAILMQKIEFLEMEVKELKDKNNN
jgi:FtsZ-binding cell division protein ZapB